MTRTKENLYIKAYLLRSIKKEIAKHNYDVDYYDTIEDIKAENKIYELAQDCKYINRDWIDERAKYSPIERYEDLYAVLKNT